jgi:hypothetical protein
VINQNATILVAELDGIIVGTIKILGHISYIKEVV